MDDEEYRLQEEEAERISELKGELAESLNAIRSVSAHPYMLERDIFVHGPLSVLIEWAQDWRSEIEELG